MTYKDYLEECIEYNTNPVTESEYYDIIIELNEVR